jgi:hypothetical protein
VCHWADQELQVTVSAFLDLRPDGYAIHEKSKRLAILEFTRAMDSSEDWEEKKDSGKRSRYAPVLEFISAGEAGLDYDLLSRARARALSLSPPPPSLSLSLPLFSSPLPIFSPPFSLLFSSSLSSFLLPKRKRERAKKEERA